MTFQLCITTSIGFNYTDLHKWIPKLKKFLDRIHQQKVCAAIWRDTVINDTIA